MRGAMVSLLALSCIGFPGPAAGADVVDTTDQHSRRCESDGSWVAAWTVPPSDAQAEGNLDSETLRNQIYPHQGGGLVRLHLTNRFGSGPVTVGAVSLGKQLSGPTTSPGTLRAVSFGGQPSVTLPVGADVVSDPIRLRVLALDTLLSSVFIEAADSTATRHQYSGSTSWRTDPRAGDQTMNPDGSSYSVATSEGGSGTGTESVSFVSGLDVYVPRPLQTVVAFGDSITDGYQASRIPGVPNRDYVDRNGRYPDFLAERALLDDVPLSVVNAGISGNRLIDGSGTPPAFGAAGVDRFHQDALNKAGVRTVLLQEGINDLGLGATRNEVVNGYRRVIRMAHRHDVRLVIGTLVPYGGLDSTDLPARRAVNHWIRTQRLSDGVVDFDRVLRMPSNHARLRPKFDSGDGIHPSRAGYRAMARAITLSDLVAPGC